MINDLLIVISIVFFLLLILKFIIKDSPERFENTTETPPEKPKNIFELKRPFVNLYDDKGNQLNVTLLSRPFFANSHYEEYKKMGKLFNILGISSYQEFPNEPFNPKDNYNKTTNKYDYNKWVDMCKGWLHCFRNPEDYLPKTMKSILLSESDFCDSNIHKPNPEQEKIYDFLYICHRDDLSDCSTNEWVAFNKNLELANKCISKLCKNTKIKGLLVGRKGCELPEPCKNLQMELTDKLDYYDLVKKYDECKLLLIPNIHDASPRVVTEAMCHNMPVLMNKKLVGGWKYINDKTGRFFNDENDFEEKIKEILDNIDSFESRKHFMENYGILNAGKQLKDFIFEIFGSKVNIPKEKIKYVTPEFKKVDYLNI